MTEENQKDILSSPKHYKLMHLAVPKHGVLVKIFKKNLINVFILSD